jgi:hypothetical protein
LSEAKERIALECLLDVGDSILQRRAYDSEFSLYQVMDMTIGSVGTADGVISEIQGQSFAFLFDRPVRQLVALARALAEHAVGGSRLTARFPSFMKVWFGCEVDGCMITECCIVFAG